MDLESVERRHGAHLPHWRYPGATYFVTFRLNDSLPETSVAQYRQDYARALNSRRLRLGRPLTRDEIAAVKRRTLRSVEELLDKGAGACILREEANAELVAKAMRHFDGDRYDLCAWTVMPNHAHAILQPKDGVDLSKILHSWKSYTAHKLPPLRDGATWESESFDHIVRSDDHLIGFVRYVLQNPVKAGLSGWRWVGCQERFRADLNL